jgi:tight adherence protein C
MFDIGLLDILFDKNFLVTMVVSMLAFATVATLATPLLEKSGLDDRLKSVARRREELRARHHAALNAKRGSLRVEPSSSALRWSRRTAARSWRWRAIAARRR